MGSGGFRLARIVALAYTLVIVYASLQPFTGWRPPPVEVLGFLSAPWPRYVTAGDVMLNVAAYLPLGATLFAALRPPLAAAPAFIAATMIAVLVSLALESAQMFLPTRIATNLDLLTNAFGAAIGALAAWALTLPMLANNPLALVRRRAVRADALGDFGLLVVALWILIQFHQVPFALGHGDLREMLNITPLFTHTPLSYLLLETGVVTLAIIATGVLVSQLLHPRQPALPAIAVTLLLALTAKSIATVTLARATNWLQWLTPGTAAGAVTGILMLALLLRLTPAARAAIALICIAAEVLIVNTAPENPYQPVPAFMRSARPTHLVNFSHIVHVLSQAWPLIAAIFLLAVGRAHRAAARS